MILNFLKGRWKYCLISVLFLFSFGNSVVYGFERGPLFKGPMEPAAPNYYAATPLLTCEHMVNTLRRTPYYRVPGPEDADILKYLAPPLPLLSSPPTNAYGCGAKVSRSQGPYYPPYIFDAYGGFAYPICNVGNAPYVSSDTICTIPDNIPDKGANAGQPDSDLCIGNPINAATGNKFALETDLELPSGLGFARSYNSQALSGSAQIGNTWRHTYQRSLYANPETVTATRPDGRLAYFRLSGSINKPVVMP